MRIAVYHNLPSGGAKRALYEQARRLAARHDLDVFTLTTANHSFCDLRPLVQKHKEYEFSPLTLFSPPFGLLNHGVRLLDLRRLRSVHRKLAFEINNGRYDVVFVHTDQFTQTPGLLRYLKGPSVYYCQDSLRAVYDPHIPRDYATLHGVRYCVDRLNVLRSLYRTFVVREDRENLRAATLVLVNSRFSYETIYRLHAVRPMVAYLGVDTQMFQPLGLGRQDYVLSVGAIASIKGFDFLIDGLACVSSEKRPRLLIVGNSVDPDEKMYLEALALKRDVQLTIDTLISDIELTTAYNTALMTLYAPVLEPFGFVPLESMACGTPVIGVAEGGVRETIRPEETGLLIDREPAALAAAITRLIEQPELATRLGSAGPEYVRRYWNWTESVNRIEVCLQTAIDRFSQPEQGSSG